MVVLLVLAVILAFLSVDYVADRVARRKRALGLGPHAVVTPGSLRGAYDVTAVPGGVFLAPGHSWIRVEPAGTVLVGAGRLPSTLLGGLERIYMLPAGTEVRRGGPLAVMRNGQRLVKLRSPVDGVIEDVNPRVFRGQVDADPYHAGWIYRVTPRRLSASLRETFIGEEATGWMRRELRRVRDLVAEAMSPGSPVPATLADGGLPVVGLAARLGDDEWTRIEESLFEAQGLEHPDHEAAGGGRTETER